MIAMMQNLDLDSPQAKAFLREHFDDAAVLRVPRTRSMAPDQCYANVADLVSRSGGMAVLGWALRQFPGRWLEATHHAVWKNPSGGLEDVTPTAIQAAHSLFIEANDQPFSGMPPAVPSKFLQIDQSLISRRWIEGNIRRVELIGAVQELISRQPRRLTSQGMEFSGTTEIMRLHNEIAQITAELNGYGQRILQGDVD
jgi:hypothetical protein